MSLLPKSVSRTKTIFTVLSTISLLRVIIAATVAGGTTFWGDRKVVYILTLLLRASWAAVNFGILAHRVGTRDIVWL